MTLTQYEEKKRERLHAAWSPRRICVNCRKPVALCFCSLLRPFESKPEFVILIHRDEILKSVATGRMSHLSLTNSLFFKGTDFTHHEGVNKIIHDPNIFPVLLYPSFGATNLSELSSEKRSAFFPSDKRLVLFIIDATWGVSKRMRRLSQNLASLPAVCFTPPSKSRFIVRRQPHPKCYSTIESIHHIIELFNEGGETRHRNLIDILDVMVAQQLFFENETRQRRRACR